MSPLHADGFDWDDANSAKCRKHDMSRAEIESVFAAAPIVGPDPFDPNVEQRWRAIGRTASGRTAFVVFTLREKSDAATYPPPFGPLHACEGGQEI